MAPLKLAYTDAGEGDPLLLVHGLFDSRRSWAGVAPRLVAHGYRVVTVDLRGHGDSPRPATGYAPLDFVGDLQALLDDLGIAAPIYVGHSMGARVGWFMATEAPLRSLVIGDIGMDPQPEAWREVRAMLDAFPLEFPDQAVAAAFLAARLPASEADYFAGRLVGSPRRWQFAFDAVVETVRLGRAHDWISLAPLIQCPVLLLRGGESTEISPGEAQRVSAAIPNCMFREIPGVGHDLHEVHPAAFADAVAAWISHALR